MHANVRAEPGNELAVTYGAYAIVCLTRTCAHSRACGSDAGRLCPASDAVVFAVEVVALALCLTSHSQHSENADGAGSLQPHYR